MKALSLLLFGLVSVLLVSCSNVVYEQPIPENQQQLTEFPDFIIGTWVDHESDTLIIGAKDFRYGDFDGSSIFSGTLSDEIILKELNNFYFLNIKSDGGYWESIAATSDSNYLYLYFVGVDNDLQLNALNNHLKKNTAKSLKKDGKYIINPEVEELFELLNDSLICKISKLIKITR